MAVFSQNHRVRPSAVSMRYSKSNASPAAMQASASLVMRSRSPGCRQRTQASGSRSQSSGSIPSTVLTCGLT